MNANELADMLEDTESYFSQDIDDRDYGMICKASTVLRQQQAEIDALKNRCALLQEGYNAQAILLGVETGLTPDFFFMENDLMGKR